MGRKCIRYKKTKEGRRCAQFGDVDDMDYPPLEGEDFLDFAWLPTMDDLKSVGIAGGAAGAGMIAVDELFNRVDFLARQNVAVKAVSKMAIGLIGGKALTGVNPVAGAGLGAGLVGDAVRNLVNAYVFKRGTEAGEEAEAETEGLGEDEEEILLGEEEEDMDEDEGLPLLGEGEEEEILLGGSKVTDREEMAAITDEEYIQSGVGW